jgi:hypothetical protein
MYLLNGFHRVQCNDGSSSTMNHINIMSATFPHLKPKQMLRYASQHHKVTDLNWIQLLLEEVLHATGDLPYLEGRLKTRITSATSGSDLQILRLQLEQKQLTKKHSCFTSMRFLILTAINSLTF